MRPSSTDEETQLSRRAHSVDRVSSIPFSAKAWANTTQS